jgi:signal transduction histidine kinase
LPSRLYVRLIGFTAGTLLMLFWIVVILGYRRQRNFERVFFFLCLALLFFYGGSLLALNSQIYYAQPPVLLATFAWTVLSAGLCFLPALLIHLHLEYVSASGSDGSRGIWKRRILMLSYALVALFAVRAYPRVAAGQGFDFFLPANTLGQLFGVVLLASLAASAGLQIKFASATKQKNERFFHYCCGLGLGLSAILVLFLHVLQLRLPLDFVIIASVFLEFLPIPLFAGLIYAVQKYNFLQIGRQTNLMYAISVTFLALLYLSLVRRVSTLLEPMLPPEATAAILLFVLVIFVEPIQRVLGKRLRETAQHEFDGVRTLIAEIRNKGREGDLHSLVSLVGECAKRQFELADAWLEVKQPNLVETLHATTEHGNMERFAVVQLDAVNAVLHVRPHGAMLSGETRAAIELLCEQLPAAIDLCRLIEEKLRLERELAERERLAVLGQMAASISHNLKNPLGSIKTILQVQLESPEMPESLKSETQMVLGEISRLSNKLGQLLQFSRPAVLGAANAGCDAARVVNEVCEVMRPEAEKTGIEIRVAAAKELRVLANSEVVSDIVSNLVVNAMEAVANGGRICVRMKNETRNALIQVEDDGKGIPVELRDKVMQPFFTTKTQGTGLGLAIVARRASEAGGRIETESPVANGRGTRFSVWLPLREETR